MLYDPKWKLPIEIPAEPIIKKKKKQAKKRKTWRSLILKAAEIIEKKGWVQNHLYEEGSFCTVGALLKADGVPVKDIKDEFFNVSRACEIAQSKITDHLWTVYDDQNIETWNDSPGQTADKVVGVLREIAKEK